MHLISFLCVFDENKVVYILYILTVRMPKEKKPVVDSSDGDEDHTAADANLQSKGSSHFDFMDCLINC